MTITWIFRMDYTFQIILVAFISLLFTTFTHAAGPPRPMLISLPINVRASIPVGPSNYHDLEESAEEQRVDERFIFRGNNQQNDYFQEDNDTPQPGFLSWNPGTQFLMLQLNDVISARRPDEGNDSDESERAESSRSRKQKRRHQQKEPTETEMEDYRRILESTRWPNASTKKTKASSVKYIEQSGEEDLSEAYGAEPVVQYMKEGMKRKNGSNSIYKNVPQDENNFEIKQWWGDY